MENQVSIRLSHDDRVGEKWKWTFGCFLSQRSHFLWVLRLSMMTCSSRSGKAATIRLIKPFSAMLETHRRVVETVVLEERISRLEQERGSQRLESYMVERRRRDDEDSC